MSWRRRTRWNRKAPTLPYPTPSGQNTPIPPLLHLMQMSAIGARNCALRVLEFLGSGGGQEEPQEGGHREEVEEVDTVVVELEGGLGVEGGRQDVADEMAVDRDGCPTHCMAGSEAAASDHECDGAAAAVA